MRAAYEGDYDLSYRIKSGSSVRTNKPASFVIDNRGRITTFTSLDAEVRDFPCLWLFITIMFYKAMNTVNTSVSLWKQHIL